MKKILIALSIIASMQVAGAQVKAIKDARNSVAKAEEATQNPKKATKAATWLNLGKAYVAAYDAPVGNVWAGASKQELALVMGGEKPVSVETVQVGGETMTKEVYATKNLYFNQAGVLAVIEPTEQVVENPLEKAVEAYAKALSIDAKKQKDVQTALEGINNKLMNDAYNKYTLGDFASASVAFEKAADALEPVSKIDTNSIYNAGFTAQFAGQNDRARDFFLRCYELGYYASDGDVFAKLAVVDPENAKKYLEDGFQKFPQSQSILIGLINYYLQNNEEPSHLFTLLDQAKANEPNNASLLYVEGNINKELGNVEKAVECYNKCAEIDPNYEFGYIGLGTMYYNNAVDLQTKAQEELDDNKYAALVAEFEQTLKACIEPFEKAYAITKDNEIKIGVAEYLKNTYYRFRDQDAKFQEGYDKYNRVVSSGVAE